MNNPWTGLPLNAPFIAEDDKEIIEASPRVFSHLRFEIPPDPYLGNLDRARVILLVLNPGFIDEDIISFKNKDYTEQNRRNLIHQAEPSFYVLNEKFSFSGGYQWWVRILKRLIEDGVSIDILADKLLCLQYFPYHSATYSHVSAHLPSQHYTFSILEEAIRQKKTIVIMRSKRLWIEAVPELEGTDYIELKNYRNPVISPNNMKEQDYQRVVELLL